MEKTTWNICFVSESVADMLSARLIQVTEQDAPRQPCVCVKVEDEAKWWRVTRDA